MADIFTSEDVQKLLENKFVIVIGDSVMRGVYKDLVLIIQRNEFLEPQMLKKKGEQSHCNDELIDVSKMTNKKTYREVRQYQTGQNLVRFYFVTSCYNSYVEYTIMRDLGEEPHPDLVIMNSCLWDVSRYGPTSMRLYKKNLCKLFACLSEVLKPECLFIWTTAMPVAKTIKGGVLVPGLEYREDTLRFDVIEGNFYAKQAVVAAGHDVLDLHYHFRNHVILRAPDGIHWNYRAHRTVTNFLLVHICAAWGVALPRRQRFHVTGSFHQRDVTGSFHQRDVTGSFHPPTRDVTGPILPLTRTIAGPYRPLTRTISGPFRPPKRVAETTFQPPEPVERNGGPTGRGNFNTHHNSDRTYVTTTGHRRTVSCDPSFPNGADSRLVTYGLDLVAANIIVASKQKRHGNQLQEPQGEASRRHHPRRGVRHHPYQPHAGNK